MPKKSRVPSVADANAARGGVAAVDRALSLLSAFRVDHCALTLGELADHARLYKSTALRLIASLEHANFLERTEDGRYTLGRAVPLLHAAYASAFSPDAVVMPVLRRLVEATGESAAFHVIQGHGASAVRVCLYRVDSPHPVRDHIKPGDILPADRGSGGRVLTAFDPVRSKTADAKSRKLYAKIREDGYVLSDGDRLAGLSGISAPVFRADGSVAGAVTLTMPSQRLKRDQVKPVLEAAKSLSGRV